MAKNNEESVPEITVSYTMATDRYDIDVLSAPLVADPTDIQVRAIKWAETQGVGEYDVDTVPGMRIVVKERKVSTEE
jgi:hypothetical protein